MTLLSEMEWEALALSLRVGICAVAGSLPLGIAVAHALARRRVPLRWLVETLINLPLVMPPVVTGYILLVLLGRHGWIGARLEAWFGWSVAFTWVGCAVASAVIGFPLMVRAMRLAFEGVDPRLESAARTLGATPWGVFFRVSLPLASRGVIAGGLLAFARGLGEFGATIMLAGNIAGRTQTIPLAIFSLVERPGGAQQAWRLVAVSLLLCCGALAASEWLERRRDAHDRD